MITVDISILQGSPRSHRISTPPTINYIDSTINSIHFNKQTDNAMSTSPRISSVEQKQYYLQNQSDI